METWLDEIIACEGKLRRLAAAGDIDGLEEPMRRMQALLAAVPPDQAESPYAPYFRMVFEQLNAALYQNAGQTGPMLEHFAQGRRAAEQLLPRLPLDRPPESAPGALRIMAQNAADFARLAGLACETRDPAAALALAGLAARLMDWLWPTLEEPQAVIAAEAHNKLASLVMLVSGDAAESARQLDEARAKFRALYKRTGNADYQARAESAGLGAAGAESITPEMAAANPALAAVLRAAGFNEQGHAAMQNGEAEKAAFYFEKAAAQAEQALKAVSLPDAQRVAALAFWGAAACTRDAEPETSRRWAARGLELARQMEADPARYGMKPREAADLRRELERLAGARKAGLLGRLFGR